jgi:hypothetical protein
VGRRKGGRGQDPEEPTWPKARAAARQRAARGARQAAGRGVVGAVYARLVRSPPARRGGCARAHAAARTRPAAHSGSALRAVLAPQLPTAALQAAGCRRPQRHPPQSQARPPPRVLTSPSRRAGRAPPRRCRRPRRRRRHRSSRPTRSGRGRRSRPGRPTAASGRASPRRPRPRTAAGAFATPRQSGCLSSRRRHLRRQTATCAGRGGWRAAAAAAASPPTARRPSRCCCGGGAPGWQTALPRCAPPCLWRRAGGRAGHAQGPGAFICDKGPSGLRRGDAARAVARRQHALMPRRCRGAHHRPRGCPMRLLHPLYPP